jgi:hypothetical protein
MKILPVAFDSFGARSMATFVETKDVRIFIDPGVSVSPDRYSLPPHTIELDRHRDLWIAIKRWVDISDIVIVTHYHYDHHNPHEPEIYKDKDVFLKHPREFINQSQKERAATFLSLIEPYAKTISIADGKTFNIGNTRIIFSEPVFHGLSAKLGFVVEVFVEESENFIFTSDVQGPLNDEALNFIIDKSPNSIFLDGPATYLVGSHYKKQDINLSMDNMKKIIGKTSVRNLVVDHHLLRDANWSDYIAGIGKLRNDVCLCSAASYLGKHEEIFEAKRKDMYAGLI